MQTTIDLKPADPPSVPAPYCGWFRPHRGGPYVRLAEGETYDGCWGALLDALHEQGRRGGDSVVLRDGENPNRSASARQRLKL